MAQRKQRPTLVLESAEPAPYRLMFQPSDDGKQVSSQAKLTSPLLDRTVHGRRGVNAYFYSLRKRKPGSRFKLDPFEVASLTAYLQQQPQIRRQLEDELLKVREWDEQGGDVRAAIWKETKVEDVAFSPRHLPSAEQAEYIRKQYKKDAERLLQVEFDAPGTRSSFEVSMAPKWGGSHFFTFIFRDGRCLEHRMEG